MVEQIPDFTLSETSGDRGLGQASQNVLVNGARVSGKTNDASATLQQISASSVERIEILDGAQLGIPGLTGRVANVVVQNRSLQVQFHWDSQYRRHVPDQLTVGGISLSGRIGASDITISLNNDLGVRRGGQGPETVFDANGLVTLTRFERDVFRKDQPRLSTTLNRRWDNGAILNLNLLAERYHFSGDFDAVAT
ncbi:MAG: TonB-dependent receptor plug domain-containing protein, partial [Sphingopyxis sp.]